MTAPQTQLLGYVFRTAVHHFNRIPLEHSHAHIFLFQLFFFECAGSGKANSTVIHYGLVKQTRQHHAGSLLTDEDLERGVVVFVLSGQCNLVRLEHCSPSERKAAVSARRSTNPI